MEENEKIIEFLISPEFYNDWFLFTTNAFNIKSTENFLKFVAVLRFLDMWVRENWSDEESFSKAKEIMGFSNFTEEEINKILNFINQNFALKRTELWQEALKTPEIVDDFDEKEKRYLEFMKTLVKFPVSTETKEKVLTTQEREEFNYSKPENVLNFQEKTSLKLDKEDIKKETKNIKSEIEITKDVKSTKTNISPINTETNISTIKFEPLTEISSQKSIENIDNIVITKKNVKTEDEESNFLDLSNL